MCLDGESKDSEAQEQGSKPWIPWKNQIENDIDPTTSSAKVLIPGTRSSISSKKQVGRGCRASPKAGEDNRP